MSSSPSAGALDGLLNPGKSSTGSPTVAPATQLSGSGGAAMSFGSAAQQTLAADGAGAPTGGARAARPAFTPGASSAFAAPSGADATPAAMASPCFVHSHLDSAVGAARKQQQAAAQSQQAPPSPRGAHAQHRRRSRPPPAAQAAAGYFGTEHAERSHAPGRSAAADQDDDAGSPSSSGTEDGRRQKEKRRPRSHRRDPSHRGPRGAAAPESGDEEHSHSSDDQGSDGSYTVSGSGSSYDEDGDSEDDRVRSLTRQLAETAVGVREMSKQLGRARVKSTIQSILIITKARDNHLITLTRELAIWLMTTPRNGRDTGLVVYVDSQLRNSKRFDAEGIKRDHPRLFEPVPRQHSRRPSTFSGAVGKDGDAAGPSSSSSSVDGSWSSSSSKEEGQLRYWTSDMCSRTPHLFDFVVTLGGDGTVLFCSWLFQRIVPPVMPFALGSLGFLTNFDFAHYADVMRSALDNGVRVNLRMRFTATVYRATLPSSTTADRKRRRAIKSGKTGEIIMRSIAQGGWDRIEGQMPAGRDLRGRYTENGGGPADEDEQRATTEEAAAAEKQDSGCARKDKEVMCFSTRPVETFEVLNDLVVDRGPSPYVSLLEVFGDEHHMTTAQADGLCISTPTGSTAYSLSAGGSLVHPEIPAILISPICPHTLSFRPMLLPDSMELRIAVPYNSRSTAWASFDGRGRVELKQGDHIKVTASRYPFPTICAENQSVDWFESISRTLKWNERQRQKSFVVVEEARDEGSPNRSGESRPSAKKDEKRSTADSAGSAEPAKSAKAPTPSPCMDLDDDDDDDDEEEATESEAFDIDDTSTTATRTNSPDPDPPGSAPPNGLHSRRHSMRRSASGEKRPRHHHSASALSSRHHHHSSAPASQKASHENLAARAGLAPLTKAAPSANGSDDGKKSSPGSDSSQLAYQHGVIQPKRGHSLLDSPDRFGLAGPPQPPRAISERHLAHADFRLDDPEPPRDKESDAPRRAPHATLNDGAAAAAAKLQSDTDDMASTPGNEKLSRAAAVLRGATEALHPSQSPPKASEAELANSSSSSSSRRRSSHRESRSRGASRDDIPPKPHRSGTGGLSGGGGTALIVRGLDESDSEIEGEY